MATTIASGNLDLGYDDCETCGGSPNYLEWEWDGNWIRVHATVGCYGSYNNSMDTEADIADFLADWRNRFPELISELEDLANDFNGLLQADSQAAVEGVDFYVLDYDDRDVL